MAVSKVFIICNAYESGVGHGFKDDGFDNPYVSNNDEHEAWELGYLEGLEQRLEVDEITASKIQAGIDFISDTSFGGE